MKIKTPGIFLLAIGATTLIGVSTSQAVTKTFSAVSAATWNAAGNWTPSGIPGSGDDVIIPSGKAVSGLGAAQSCASLSVGGSITNDNQNFTVSGATIVSNAATLTISSSTGTKAYGDIIVQSGGIFNGIANGNLGTISGSITNDGFWNTYSGGQSTIFTLSGTSKIIAGAGVYSNQSVNITGTYTTLPGVVFITGANNTGSSHLQGSGGLVNQGVIYYHSSPGGAQAPEITTLDCTTVGNTFIWTNVNTTITPKATPYYNLILGNLGSSGVNLNGVGLAISNNFTLVGVGNISSWPANNTIGGTFTYSTSSGSVSTFPTAFSIGGFNQTSGALALAANSILTVTGTGAGTWTRTGGPLTINPSSTVKFTGAAPGFSGGFANVIIDSTATNASVTAPFGVTNALTINSGGSLDVTALTTYTLSVTQSVVSSGTIVGSINATVNSKAKLYAGTDGGYGTNTITGNLTLSATNSINLDVNATAAAANDLLVVGGTLALSSSNLFNLKAPSAGASIDTANDYTLVTAGSISGTPVLNWVTGFVPASSTNYTLVVSGGAIKLHYAAIVPTGSPTLTVSNNAGTLTLSWDSTTFPGYSVQAQTNSAAAGLGTNWSGTGSGTVSPFILTRDPANPAVFFRLAHP